MKPGWYQYEDRLRWWDGYHWGPYHEYPSSGVEAFSAWGVPTHPVYAVQPAQVVRAPVRHHYISGLDNGQHLRWFVASLLTLGIAAPFWAMAAWSSRRSIR